LCKFGFIDKSFKTININTINTNAYTIDLSSQSTNCITHQTVSILSNDIV